MPRARALSPRRGAGSAPIRPTRATLVVRAVHELRARAQLGLPGTASDVAKSFASYGKRLQGPKVGAIAVMNRGKSGGHVGVVSGFDKDGDPIVISGNHSRRVAEAVYPRGPHHRLRDAGDPPENCGTRSRRGASAADGQRTDPRRRRVRARSDVRPGTSHRRNRHSGAARPSAVEPLSHPGGRGARHHLDSRRARGDAGGLARRRAEGEPGAAIQQRRRRTCRRAPISPARFSARCSSAG